MLIEWEHKFSSGDIDGKCGKWICFGIIWDGSRPKGSDIPPYKLSCNLPGIKNIIGNFETIDAAKEKAEGVMNYWLSKAGL